MNRLHSVGTLTRPHSNTVCDCQHCKAFDYANTVITPRRSMKPSMDDTIPSTRHRRPMMKSDDCIRLHSIDTETQEHIIEYVAPDETVIMTQTVSAQQWALYESPFARRRRPARAHC